MLGRPSRIPAEASCRRRTWQCLTWQNASRGLVCLLATALNLAHARAPPTVSWAGSLTATSVKLSVQPTEEKAILLVSKVKNLMAPVAQLEVTRDTFIVHVRGLVPETQYYYGLDGGAAGSAAEFKTPSLSVRGPFRVAVGSCSWSTGNGAVFQNIAALEPRPLAFVHRYLSVMLMGARARACDNERRRGRGQHACIQTKEPYMHSPEEPMHSKIPAHITIPKPATLTIKSHERKTFNTLACPT